VSIRQMRGGAWVVDYYLHGRGSKRIRKAFHTRAAADEFAADIQKIADRARVDLAKRAFRAEVWALVEAAGAGAVGITQERPARRAPVTRVGPDGELVGGDALTEEPCPKCGGESVRDKQGKPRCRPCESARACITDRVRKVRQLAEILDIPLEDAAKMVAAKKSVIQLNKHLARLSRPEEG
jgi:uncharacterized Zn finger protein (UPF0148 family)